MQLLPAHTSMLRSSFPEVIFACAWCPPETYIQLKEHQEYTHGMCRYHKYIFIHQVKERVGRIRKSLKKQVVIRLKQTI